jgi:hypothetical protein
MAFVLIIGLLLAMVAGIAVGVKEQREREAFMQAHECKLIDVSYTGERRYCGKACWHDEQQYTYACNDGFRTELH